MRRRIERGTKARLSLSGGPHVPVNMADSLKNAGSWTVSGSKEAIGVSKNFKDLRKLDVRNNSAVQRSKRAISFGVFSLILTSSILSVMFKRACGPPV